MCETEFVDEMRALFAALLDHVVGEVEECNLAVWQREQVEPEVWKGASAEKSGHSPQPEHCSVQCFERTARNPAGMPDPRPPVPPRSPRAADSSWPCRSSDWCVCGIWHKG
jgi:hypothetical protein